MSKHRILLAEDDSITRFILETCLKDMGYHVVSVPDGDEAWNILVQDNSPHIAVVDWMMPGMDGIELCRKIREQNKEQYTYIVLLTSKSDIHDMVTGLEAGADDYLVKPVSPQELNVRLRSGLRILDLQEKLIKARDELKEIAIHDSLTGLYNRGWINNVLNKELIKMERENRPLSVIMADIDHFKKVNDTYGHPAGDQVLCEVARRISKTVRCYDTVGRYGGEEFVVVLPGITQKMAFHLAERIRCVINSKPVSIPCSELPISISLGISDNQVLNSNDPAVLIQAADQALYSAKENGRNQTVLIPSAA